MAHHNRGHSNGKRGGSRNTATPRPTKKEEPSVFCPIQAKQKRRSSSRQVERIAEVPSDFCARTVCDYGWDCFYIHVYYHPPSNEYYVKCHGFECLFKICETYTIQGWQCVYDTDCWFVHSDIIYENFSRGYLIESTNETVFPISALNILPSKHPRSKSFVTMFRMVSTCGWDVTRGRGSRGQRVKSVAGLSMNGYRNDRSQGRGYPFPGANGRGRSAEDVAGRLTERENDQAWSRSSSPTLNPNECHDLDSSRRGKDGGSKRSKSHSPTTSHVLESISREEEEEGTNNLSTSEADKLLSEFLQKKREQDEVEKKGESKVDEGHNKEVNFLIDLSDVTVLMGEEESITHLNSSTDDENKRREEEGNGMKNTDNVFMCKVDELLFGNEASDLVTSDFPDDSQRNSTKFNGVIPKIVITNIPLDDDVDDVGDEALTPSSMEQSAFSDDSEEEESQEEEDVSGYEESVDREDQETGEVGLEGGEPSIIIEGGGEGEPESSEEDVVVDGTVG